MRRATVFCLVAVSALCECVAQASDMPGATCESIGPRNLQPKTFSSIGIGMTRAEVELILGTPDYSPVDGQYYFATPGQCEVAPGRTAGCGYVIDYRDYSKEPPRNSGRVTSCWWGGIGE